MSKELKKVNIFYISTVIFSWFVWAFAMAPAIKQYIMIPYDHTLFDVLEKGYKSDQQMSSHFFFVIALLGPLVGMFVNHLFFKDKIKLKFKKPSLAQVGLVFIFPILLIGTGLLMTRLFTNSIFMPMFSLKWMAIIFIMYALVTSVQEIAWRTYIQPLLLKKYSKFKAFLMIGIMSSIFTFPVFIFINYNNGFISTLLTLLMATLIIIEQSFLNGIIYDKTKNIILTIMLQAWTYTVALYLLSLPSNINLALITILFIYDITMFMIVSKYYNKDYLGLLKKRIIKSA